MNMNIKEQLDKAKQELFDNLIKDLTKFQTETGIKIITFSFAASSYDKFPDVTCVGMDLRLEK